MIAAPGAAVRPLGASRPVARGTAVPRQPAPVTRITRSSRTPSANTCDLSAGGESGRWYEGMGNGKHEDMQIPGVHIETLHNPVRYTYAQIEKACAIAQMLNRGKLVLVEPPRR